VFRNVGTSNSDAGELPRRKHTTKNYKFERVKNFKYLRVTLNEDNNNQIDLQERTKNANKTYFVLERFLKIKTYQRN
jgi:hypothetical protein